MKKLILLFMFFTISFGQYHNVVSNYTNIKHVDHSNPAWFIEKYIDDFYAYEISMDNDQGKLKLPYTPEKILDINYLARGEKKLFENGVFSGYVSYHQQKLENKQWIHNRIPYQGFPFLLADSSVGDVDLNGIHWQVGYSHEIIKNKLFLGTSLFYNVDEEMKQVFPKPINKHRDMVFSLGIGTKISQKLQLGFNYKYFDFQELLKTGKYSLEQGKTPLFFKIRGLDNPLIFRGLTSVERDMEFIGNSFQMDGKLNSFFFKEANFLIGYENCDADAVDGGAYPVNQGKMQSDEYFYSSNIILPFFRNNEWNFFSYGNQLDQRSNHPDIDIEIFEYHQEQIAFGTGLQINLFRKILLQPTLFGSSQYMKRVDKFNGILEYYPSTSLGGSLGFDLIGFEKFHISCQSGIEQTLINDSEIFLEGSDWYYQQITKVEQDYFNADKSRFWLTSNLMYHLKNNKSIILSVNYNSQSTINNHEFENMNREGLSVNLKIEFRK